MDPREVVVHVEKRDGVNQIVEFLGKRVRQTREATHTHPHVKILAFYVAGRNVFRFRPSDNSLAFGAKTLRGGL